MPESVTVGINRGLITVLIVIAGTSLLSARELQERDTVRIVNPAQSEPVLSFNRPIPLIIPRLEDPPAFEVPLPFLFVPVSVSAFPLLIPNDPFPRPDLTSPLTLQRASEEKNKLLYQVLGTVQIGGVAYLAYRHIKKYGFMK